MPLIRSLLLLVWMLVTVIPWGLALLLGSVVVRGPALWWFAVSWMRVVVWGARVIVGIRVRVTGLEHITQAPFAAAVLLAKHQSTFETLLLPTLVPHPMAFVFKRELLRIPFFGWSMARLDMIHIDRAAHAQALLNVLAQGQRLLARRVWVILFPEGTRVARGERGNYRTAGARLAIKSGVPVFPIALSCAKCWPRKGFVKYPGVVDVSIGPAIPSAGRESKELMREVETWIETEMRRIDPQAYH